MYLVSGCPLWPPPLLQSSLVEIFNNQSPLGGKGLFPDFGFAISPIYLSSCFMTCISLSFIPWFHMLYMHNIDYSMWRIRRST